jgi:hypothetical protein
MEVAADENQFHEFDFSYQILLHLGWPLVAAFVLAIFRSSKAPRMDRFLACYVVVSAIGYRMPFLPWPQHFIHGLYYAAAVLIVRRMETTSWLAGLWVKKKLWCFGFGALLVGAALAPHIYFRYVGYRNAATATELMGEVPAVAPLDEVRAIAWLRAHGTSEKLILAPLENAPWMATVPMHSFGSHWIFSLTNYQQDGQSTAFFHGDLSYEEANALLRSYGVRYVLAPAGSPALQYLHNAELRWAGERLVLYELPYNDMRSIPRLTKISPGDYRWNPE